MREKCVIKRVLAGIMVFATVALAGKTSALVDGNVAVAEAAGRVVTINSCLIQGGDVVVNVSAATLPSSDDGYYYAVRSQNIVLHPHRSRPTVSAYSFRSYWEV